MDKCYVLMRYTSADLEWADELRNPKFQRGANSNYQSESPSRDRKQSKPEDVGEISRGVNLYRKDTTMTGRTRS